ncbi:unnamed protein product, partial [Nesidiocoris tenuis]
MPRRPTGAQQVIAPVGSAPAMGLTSGSSNQDSSSQCPSQLLLSRPEMKRLGNFEWYVTKHAKRPCSKLGNYASAALKKWIDPDVYGVRRSNRARKEPDRLNTGDSDSSEKTKKSPKKSNIKTGLKLIHQDGGNLSISVGTRIPHMTARLIKNVKSLLEVNRLDGESLLQHQLLGQLQRNQLLEPDRVLTPILPSRAMNLTIIEHD